ncbi:hypothetical protein AU14_15215 [Marinobacter similis]|uniref:Uncharacterized protein n=1 Tax=Marinobacter similis TaxID=1420916 RepID=W5YMC6_9GAMM|nr:hypothetical protein AU14_15215 [Marinobacter similis]
MSAPGGDWQVVKGVFFQDLKPASFETDEQGAVSELNA